MTRNTGRAPCPAPPTHATNCLRAPTPIPATTWRGGALSALFGRPASPDAFALGAVLIDEVQDSLGTGSCSAGPKAPCSPRRSQRSKGSPASPGRSAAVRSRSPSASSRPLVHAPPGRFALSGTAVPTAAAPRQGAGTDAFRRKPCATTNAAGGPAARGRAERPRASCPTVDQLAVQRPSARLPKRPGANAVQEPPQRFAHPHVVHGVEEGAARAPLPGWIRGPAPLHGPAAAAAGEALPGVGALHLSHHAPLTRSDWDVIVPPHPRRGRDHHAGAGLRHTARARPRLPRLVGGDQRPRPPPAAPPSGAGRGDAGLRGRGPTGAGGRLAPPARRPRPAEHGPAAGKKGAAAAARGGRLAAVLAGCRTGEPGRVAQGRVPPVGGRRGGRARGLDGCLCERHAPRARPPGGQVGGARLVSRRRSGRGPDRGAASRHGGRSAAAKPESRVKIG
jgi:hypothetical protein